MRHTLDRLSRGWWTFLVRGIAAIAFGALFLASPAAGLAWLALVFGVYSVTDGAFALSSGIMAGFRRERWGFLVASGLLGIGVGFAALAWPGLTAASLFYMIAFWAISTGVLHIATAIRFRNMLAHEWTLGIAGILSVALGALMLARPRVGLAAFGGLVATYAFAFAVTNIILAFEIRSLSTRVRDRLEHRAHA